ncbi:MAG: VOC family protein [Henriciella sp.]|uniref:VOC family protein n=1 Tax=Henriciella sp. TaxID=1968823 RepID=UPI003C7723E7
MAKVIGVGGVFFLCQDPEATQAWYKRVLGLEGTDFGGFVFSHEKSAGTFPKGAMTIFSPFKSDSDYFKPSERDVMFNLMVDDLAGLLKQVEAEGVEQVSPVEDHDYGTFAWIMDPDGRKIELWQPKEPAS